MLNAPYEVVKQRMVLVFSLLGVCLLSANSHCVLLGGGRHAECVATSLIEGIVKRSKDPSYMEYIVKCALGAMYTGECWYWWMNIS